MDEREQRGLELAAVKRIRQDGETWIVPSASGDGKYTVTLGDEPTCSCPDHQTRRVVCKHVYAVRYTITRESQPDGTETVTETLTETRRTSYTQQWHSYNQSQTEEGDRFRVLLAGLCRQVEQPLQVRGRPRLPLGDMALSSVLKVYTGFSARRFDSEVRRAQLDGLISCAPSFNSVNRYLSDEAMTPILKAMIETSALPLRGVEQDFAVDSTGFATSRFVRWYSKKHEGVQDNHEWVKCHAMVGVTTGVITSVEITNWMANDNPYLPSLVEDTARRFSVREVSADKGYVGRNNTAAIEAVGAMPYIVFKKNNVVTKRDRGSPWERMYHAFAYNRDDFMQHYHKRSNVESTFGAIKAKFGSSVRAKTDAGQMNEVLAKVLCHNICVLIKAMLQLGIEA